MEGYYVLNVQVMNRDGTRKQIKFIVDTTTTWSKIRSFICNDGGDIYYLCYDDGVLFDDEYVIPLLEQIDYMGEMVCATTDRGQYMKRIKKMRKVKPKTINYRTNVNNIKYEDEEMVECY